MLDLTLFRIQRQLAPKLLTSQQGACLGSEPTYLHPEFKALRSNHLPQKDNCLQFSEGKSLPPSGKPCPSPRGIHSHPRIHFQPLLRALPTSEPYSRGFSKRTKNGYWCPHVPLDNRGLGGEGLCRMSRALNSVFLWGNPTEGRGGDSPVYLTPNDPKADLLHQVHPHIFSGTNINIAHWQSRPIMRKKIFTKIIVIFPSIESESHIITQKEIQILPCSHILEGHFLVWKKSFKANIFLGFALILLSFPLA